MEANRCRPAGLPAEEASRCRPAGRPAEEASRCRPARRGGEPRPAVEASRCRPARRGGEPLPAGLPAVEVSSGPPAARRGGEPLPAGLPAEEASRGRPARPQLMRADWPTDQSRRVAPAPAVSTCRRACMVRGSCTLLLLRGAYMAHCSALATLAIESTVLIYEQFCAELRVGSRRIVACVTVLARLCLSIDRRSIRENQQKHLDIDKYVNKNG